MIRLNIDAGPSFTKGQHDININLLFGDIKSAKLIGFYGNLDKLYSKFIDKEVWDSWPGDKPLTIWATGKLSVKDFFNYRLVDIPGNTCISIDNIGNNENIGTIELTNETIAFRIWYSHLDWNNDWSVKALFDEIKSLYKTDKFYKFKHYKEDLEEEYAAISFYADSDLDHSIEGLYNILFPIVEDLHQRALDNIIKKFVDYPFKAQFDFPDHIKHECEQYLSYFGQFLHDLGIESHTETIRKGREILFSVSPKNKDEAIGRISQAFSLFLTMPVLNTDDIRPISSDVGHLIKFQRMAAAVNHLKSQLKLAEATILAQQDHILTLKELNTNALITSLTKVVQKEKVSDGVTFFNGLIKINRFEGKGFEVDTPKLIHKAKEMAKRLLK